MEVNDERNGKLAASFHYKYAGRAVFSKHHISAPALESFDVSRGGFIHGSIARDSLTNLVGNSRRHREHGSIANAWRPAMHQNCLRGQPLNMSANESLRDCRQVR